MVTESGTINVSSSNKAVSATADSGSIKKVSDNRRSNKPIMEKRRRARINNCLNELKSLILDAMKKDPARHSKLEKADILEMTVKHLQNMQRQQQHSPPQNNNNNTDSVAGKFRAGFSECASEVGRFPGLEPHVRRRLLQHLASTLTQKVPHASNEPLHIEQHAPNNSTNVFLDSSGMQLVPTRLPNGDIALVLPHNGPSTSSSPVPLLIPIPTRTSSTASATSSSSSSSQYSSVPGSPEPPMEAMRYSPSMQKPLSLVMRKSVVQVDPSDKPWRPW